MTDAKKIKPPPQGWPCGFCGQYPPAHLTHCPNGPVEPPSRPNEIDIEGLRRTLDPLKRLPDVLDELAYWRSTVGRDIVTEAYEAMTGRAEAAEARVKELEGDIKDRADFAQKQYHAFDAATTERDALKERCGSLALDVESQASYLAAACIERDALKAKLGEVREWAAARVHNEDSDDQYYRGFGAACRAVMNHTAILGEPQ